MSRVGLAWQEPGCSFLGGHIVWSDGMALESHQPESVAVVPLLAHGKPAPAVVAPRVRQGRGGAEVFSPAAAQCGPPTRRFEGTPGAGCQTRARRVLPCIGTTTPNKCGVPLQTESGPEADSESLLTSLHIICQTTSPGQFASPLHRGARPSRAARNRRGDGARGWLARRMVHRPGSRRGEELDSGDDERGGQAEVYIAWPLGGLTHGARHFLSSRDRVQDTHCAACAWCQPCASRRRWPMATSAPVRPLHVQCKCGPCLGMVWWAGHTR